MTALVRVPSRLKHVNGAFRAARVAAGYSMLDVASLVGCSTATVQRVEAGVRVPDLATREVFAEIFGVAAHELFPTKEG